MDAPQSRHTRLLYVSRALKDINDQTVERILRKAQSNNARDGITGVLLAYGGHFLQVLEGPAEQVRNCFERIRTDPRHHEAQLLQQTDLDHREFGPWAMRHVQTEQAREPALAGFLESLTRRPGATDVSLALGLLRRLASPPPPPPVPG
jgi:hypothetical protein